MKDTVIMDEHVWEKINLLLGLAGERWGPGPVRPRWGRGPCPTPSPTPRLVENMVGPIKTFQKCVVRAIFWLS